MSMTAVHKALYSFWSQFGCAAYLAGHVPDDAEFPYITFSVGAGDALAEDVLTAFDWHRAENGVNVNAERAELLDKIQLALPPVPLREMLDAPCGESSAEIRARVVAARERQRVRFAGHPGLFCNADMRSRDIGEFCRLSRVGQEKMRNLLLQLDLSARAYDRVLKVARTVADLAGSDEVTETHVMEASTWRELDHNYWT